MSVAYDFAKEAYAKIGIDTDEAVLALEKIKISLHCWQADDVQGFEPGTSLSGGISATGNYIGKARNFDELTRDLDKVFSMIAGSHKINIHAIYAVLNGEVVERKSLEPRHFKPWVDYANERGLGLDINPTLFSHEMANDTLTLSHPDKNVRDYWIEHCKAMRKIGAYFGEKTSQTCLNNIWIPDGYKDVPADRLSPRFRLKESLDEILSVKYNEEYLADSVESKVFGIGIESYTVGSHEFYMNYAAKNNILCLLDNGHFHPTETVSDKISAMLLFSKRLALHITRGVRWDSDHAVAFDDELKEITKELVAANALNRVFIGLDYFDASINRLAAYVLGMRNLQKALLYALLIPHKNLAELQNDGDFTSLIVLQEEQKTLPFSAVWDYFCEKNNVPKGSSWLLEIQKYEKTELNNRS